MSRSFQDDMHCSLGTESTESAKTPFSVLLSGGFLPGDKVVTAFPICKPANLTVSVKRAIILLFSLNWVQVKCL